MGLLLSTVEAASFASFIRGSSLAKVPGGGPFLGLCCRGLGTGALDEKADESGVSALGCMSSERADWGVNLSDDLNDEICPGIDGLICSRLGGDLMSRSIDGRGRGGRMPSRFCMYGGIGCPCNGGGRCCGLSSPAVGGRLLGPPGPRCPGSGDVPGVNPRLGLLDREDPGVAGPCLGPGGGPPLGACPGRPSI